MANIIPFKAIRPSVDKVGLVTCRTYDDYSSAELAAWLSFNPYSFLHVLHPAYVYSQKITFDKRFKGVAHKYEDFKKEGILTHEDHPCFYIYEIETKEHTFTGIICGVSLDDYKKNKIKKHEDTLPYRVELFKDYLNQTNFNTEPVLLTYPDSNEINTFVSLRKKGNPLYHFATTNKEKHTLWKIDVQNEIDWLIETFEKVPNLYIADGHHRMASAELLNDQQTNNTNTKNVLSFIIPESTVKIYEFNRLIHDLNGHLVPDFLKLLSENFIIVQKNQELWKPENKFEFGMYLDGSFYALFYKHQDQNSDSIINQLDAQILYDKVLHPLLGIEDLRNDERIDYVSGKQSISTLKTLIDEGAYEVGFILYPSDINEIKLLADNNLIMPPKSTYIEPKFRSGLVVYEL